MLLSIGMIVKNEEKNLRKCLESLSSLRENISCELIIADTGSDDNTKTIASEFTDIVFDFPWCDDFAAARNSTLKYATGKWYLLLDADEYFEDTKEIETFFASEEHQNYNCASLIIRSYLNEAKTEYSDNSTCRLFRIDSGKTKFVSKIHEYIPVKEPVKMMKTHLHHTGYIADNTEFMQMKNKRNISLMMQELDAQPNNTRLISHLINEYSCEEDHDKILDLCDKAMQYMHLNLDMIIKKVPGKINLKIADFDNNFYPIISNKMYILYLDNNWYALENTVNEYFENKKETVCFDATAIFYQAECNFHMRNYELGSSLYCQYFDLFDKIKTEQMKTFEMLYGCVECVSNNHYKVALGHQLLCYTHLEKYQDAYSTLLGESLENIDVVSFALPIITKHTDYSMLNLFLEKYMSDKNPNSLLHFYQTVEAYCTAYPQYLNEISAVFSNSKTTDIYNYHLLCTLRLNDEMPIPEKLIHLNPLPRFLSDTLYCLLKRRINLSTLFQSIPSDDFKYYAADITQRHKDYPEVVLDYFSAIPFSDNIVGMQWNIILLEKYILDFEDCLSYNNIFILQQYLKNIVRYVHKLYHPDLLQESSIAVLPNYARFAYYIEQAHCADQSGDELGYYRNMTQAIDQYKVMAKPMKLLINYHREKQENKKKYLLQDNQELMELAAQVKKQLYSFVEQKNYSAAKEVLSSYDKIIPNDPDLSCIREVIQSDGSLFLSTVPS